MLSKFFWLFFNMFDHRFSVSQNTKMKSCDKKLICVLIEYDAFAERGTKQVANVTYKCGKESLDLVENECISRSIPVLKVTTTDGNKLSKITSYNYQEMTIKNRGTDIAALEDVISVISDYQNVLFCNSSAPYKQLSNYIDEFFNVFESNSNKCAFAIGLNGNSRPSPALPRFCRKFPHVTSNFVCAKVDDVKCVLDIGANSFLYRVAGGYGNKYFAIRYFETLLSAYVIKKGGDLIVVGKTKCTYPGNHQWFSEDSRLKEYSE